MFAASAHVNTAEGFFSIFKRGMTGVYQHCDERHLHRYLSEFDFRYSNRVKLGVDDTERARLAIVGAEGKRLTYRRTRSQESRPPRPPEPIWPDGLPYRRPVQLWFPLEMPSKDPKLP